jgi:two-component system cell cycle sensor histidine kinase/response regulator CckA
VNGLAENPDRVLVVDDELPLLIVMEQYLTRLGYRVAACRSGEDAWRKFEPEPSAYGMVIADITMPDMSGQELLERMLARNPSLRILICSGYPFDIATLPTVMPNQIGYLQKPFTPKLLAEAIERLKSDSNDAAGI